MTGDFEWPLGMVSECHARIARHCATLQRLVRQSTDRGCDAEARAAAALLVDELDLSMRQQRADDEDLFPALLEAMAGSDAVCLREMTAHLSAQHRELDARWRRVRGQLERVVAGEDVLIEPEEVDALVTLYGRHIEREEHELLPMAARLLSDSDLERLGRSMRGRRGLQTR